jgi:hypothetical protein
MSHFRAPAARRIAKSATIRTVSALLRRFRFVAAIVVGGAAAIAADVWLGLGRGAALAAIVVVAIVYMIVEWRYDEMPERRRSRKSRTPYRSPFAVSFDDEEIIVTLDGARRESVKWQDLITVGIRIDQDGFLPATYWVLGGTNGGCYFPTEAEGNQALLEALQTRLPDFDNRALIEAMGLMEGGRVVWQRPAAGV